MKIWRVTFAAASIDFGREGSLATHHRQRPGRQSDVITPRLTTMWGGGDRAGMTLCAGGPPPILGGGKLVEVGWSTQKFYPSPLILVNRMRTIHFRLGSLLISSTDHDPSGRRIG